MNSLKDVLFNLITWYISLFVVFQRLCLGRPQIQQQKTDKNASQSWGILAIYYIVCCFGILPLCW